MELFTKEFGKAFIFKKIRPKIRSFFLKAGYDDVPYGFFGWLFYVTLVMTAAIYLFSLSNDEILTVNGVSSTISSTPVIFSKNQIFLPSLDQNLFVPW